MPLYMLIKVDFGHRENVGLFYTRDRALSAQEYLEVDQFDSGSLEGISFHIEEHYVR